MEDTRIIDLYWTRSEKAIAETSAKYGKYCYAIAYNILSNPQDADECVNDTYLKVWNLIPPNRPTILSAFLGKIVRRVSIDKWRSRNVGKRGSGEIIVALEELSECVPSSDNVEKAVEAAELERIIGSFVMSLPVMERRVFICRYWYLDSLGEICQQFGFTQSKVKMMLHRTRGKLLLYLKKESVIL